MNTDLTGKTALVCGASRGIGKACALELAQLGCRVIAFSRSKEHLETLLTELKNTHSAEHQIIAGDIAQWKDLKSQLEVIIQNSSLDIVINNTGGPKGGPIVDADASAFRDAFENHLIANSQLAQFLVPHMKKHSFGRIINIISTSVLIPIPNLGVSNTIRASVAAWAKTLSSEVAPFGITVNSVLPGATYTDRLINLIKARAERENISFEEAETAWKSTIPMKRFGSAEEIAALVGFLASPAAGYITGEAIRVDGGRTGTI